MSVLFVAVPAALAVAISAVIAFLWAARSGQLDDLETPALRMLHDELSRAAPKHGSAPAATHAEPGAGASGAPAPRR
jgi:cbb3-type cytochrome oxidase maturation protein